MCESIRVFRNVPLGRYTTFGIGGRARKLITVCEPEAIAGVVTDRTFIFGGGSNLLVGDGGVKGDIVRFVSDRAELKPLGGDVYYASGCMRLPLLAKAALESSLSGLEWAVGIPGTLGGAVKMNAGAYGSCIGDSLKFADVLIGGKSVRREREGLKLSYRSSETGGIVLGAALKLSKADREDIAFTMKQNAAKRRATQPLGKSAGCIYKAHCGIPAYRYIVGAGLVGLRHGDAVVSAKHANFIVNDGHARAADVVYIMDEIERIVESEYGVRLEREVKLIGDF